MRSFVFSDGRLDNLDEMSSLEQEELHITNKISVQRYWRAYTTLKNHDAQIQLKRKLGEMSLVSLTLGEPAYFKRQRP